MKLLLPSRYPSVFRRSSGLASDNAPPLHSNTAAGESCQLGDQPQDSTVNLFPLNKSLPSLLRTIVSHFLTILKEFLAPLAALLFFSKVWMLDRLAANQAPPSGRASSRAQDWSAGVQHPCQPPRLLSSWEQPLPRAACFALPANSSPATTSQSRTTCSNH